MAEGAFSRILVLTPLLPLNTCRRKRDKNPLGWTKDEVLTDEIIEMSGFFRRNPDYIYTISAQGHGAYPEEELLIDDPEITVSGASYRGAEQSVGILL